MPASSRKIVYIVGHRNPDIDSLCSALGYAQLKNLTDPRADYRAVRCSHLSDGSKRILSRLDITPPPYLSNVYPKVEDVMLTGGQRLEANDSLLSYARDYRDTSPSAAPVFENGVFRGLITVNAISDWVLHTLSRRDSITEIPTIGEVMIPHDIVLHRSDSFEDGKRTLQNSPYRGLAVFDEDGTYCGLVTRRCFLDTPRYNVILVDHNEREQSIRGIETANILEIIDHHRLNALKTDLPLFIDAEPLGSTCTIVYELYRRNGIRPDPQTAKILLAGVLTDTLILHSPTTTRTDRDAADALSSICGEEAEEMGTAIFSAIEGLRTRDPLAAIRSDFKLYTEGGLHIGIGQCEVTTLSDIGAYAGEYLAALADVKAQDGLDWALLMITDVIREQSVLLSTPFRAAGAFSYPKRGDGIYDMPHVMSRKKQLLPEVLHAIKN